MKIALGILSCLLVLSAAHAAPPDTEVLVMIVGTFHMANPGRDVYNMKADDMLAPKRQTEIKAVTDALARFRPTIVAIEGSADATARRFTDYLSGVLKPAPDEGFQLGFRLAKTAHLSMVHGINVPGDFPYDQVKAYADAHGQSALLEEQGARMKALVLATNDTLRNGSVGNTLRFINGPLGFAKDNEYYRTMLEIGDGTTQPGADLLTAWYRRNFLICANLIQLIKPGDRVVVFYGAGHAFLLRQCVEEMPDFRLVEPNDYLPD